MDKKEFDSLPIEVKIVFRILLKNKMLPLTDTTTCKGHSLDDPIVIGISDGHIPSEYIVSDFLLHDKPHKFELQASIHHQDRVIDKLIYRVTNPDGTTYTENLYYDITEGFHSCPPELLDLIRKTK